MLDNYLPIPRESDPSESQQAGIFNPAESDSIADADDPDSHIAMINLLLAESDSGAPSQAATSNRISTHLSASPIY